MAKKMTLSYTAASGGFPIKIYKNLDLLSSIITHRKIPPIHLQLNPTNHCNLKCEFCSCSERDKSLQLSADQITRIFREFSELGCQSVTITGGGEPLLWKDGQLDLNWVIEESIKNNIAPGFVTNGYALCRLSDESLGKAVWARISASDETDVVDLFESIKHSLIKIDWSFSYVVTNKPNINNIIEIVKFANEHAFTHVRMVNDILKPVTDLASLRGEVLKAGINDRLVIWQDRQHYTVGTKRCLISLLKPIVGADGLIYPCCGSQYAMGIPDRDYSKHMVMGNLNDLHKIWANQEYYNGIDCVKCYYEHYNTILANLIDDVDHQLFV